MTAPAAVELMVNIPLLEQAGMQLSEVLVYLMRLPAPRAVQSSQHLRGREAGAWRVGVNGGAM